MEKSLKLLNINSSGFENKFKNKSDNEVYKEANQMLDLNQKITFLKNNLNDSSYFYIKSKRYLAELIKDIDPQLACNLLFANCRDINFFTEDYLLIAKILIQNKAWSLAKEVLEAAKMICPNLDENSLKEVLTLLAEVTEKINKNEKDYSSDILNKILIPHKFWVLDQLCRQSEIKLAVYYSFKLLNNKPINYKDIEIAYKIFSSIDNKMIFNAFIKHLKDNKELDENYKDLFLGLSYYSLSDLETSIKYLERLSKLKFNNENINTYLALSYLGKEDIDNFKSTINKTPASSDSLYVALYFISCAISEIKLDDNEFPNQKNISSEIGKIVAALLKLQKRTLVNLLIGQFKKLDIHLTLPYLYLYLAEALIKGDMLPEAKDLLKVIEEKDTEVHRLYAWIYRLEKKEDLANKELIKYRTESLFNTKIPNSIQYQMVDLNLPCEISDNTEEILNLLKNAYNQTKDITNQIELEYGINKMTCAETGCQDCCKKTFPLISYTEYLYMRSWLNDQSKEYKEKIYKESKMILTLFKEKYKKDPPFLTGTNIETEVGYPFDFSFTCPYLRDNKCNVYEARPFTCRAYGYGSTNGIRYNGCSYFSAQFKSATKLHNLRKVINMKSFKDFASLTDEKLIGKSISAPIPIWFAYSHEEVLEKIKNI